MEAPAVHYRSDPALAAALAKEYSAAIKATVATLLPVDLWRRLQWADSMYPAIVNVGELEGIDVCGLNRVPARTQKVMFKDERAMSEFERGDGMIPEVRRTDPRRGVLFSPVELAALFDTEVLPAQLKPSTRDTYWNGWRQTIVYGLVHECVDEILPMSVEHLKAFTLELLLVGASANSIKNVWSAIEHRHRLAGLQPPLVTTLSFTRLFKAVASIKATPGRLQLPIGTHHLQALLRLRGLTKVEKRAVLVTVTGTVAASRPGEVANMQMCDALWGIDAAYHESLEDGLGIRIYQRKQDTGRFGLYIRVPDSELTALLKRFIADMGLQIDQGRCTKTRNPGARCKFCDPLFPKVACGRKGTVRIFPLPLGPGAGGPLKPMSRQQVSSAVKVAMALLGVDTRLYSGVSMRRGGITAAVQANVPESILFLQSGHGTAMAGRRYVDPVDPRVLYATGRAILGMEPH